MNPITCVGVTRKRFFHQRAPHIPPYAPRLTRVTPIVAQAHGNGRGGGFFTIFSASVSMRLTSARFGTSVLASAIFAAAAL